LPVSGIEGEIMTRTPITLEGLWLPLITPFLDGEMDTVSLRRLIRHFASQPVDGLVLAGTTGEALTLSEKETEDLVRITVGELEALGHRIPILLGVSGSDTRKVIRTLAETSGWPIDGYLVACPYYTRPSQDGLYGHFSSIAEGTDRPVVIYNIPYRTGVNMANDTMLRLAEHANIIGVKDCSADPEQSFELLSQRPESFAVMTGEDLACFSALCSGADGAILSAAHVRTADFARLHRLILEGDLAGARTLWKDLYCTTKALFSEPSPAAHKTWMWREGLIESNELRLPMAAASTDLVHRIDELLAHSPNIDEEKVSASARR
jgi:4-hydroxy-tetrahydrodipicolinate synthase